MGYWGNYAAYSTRYASRVTSRSGLPDAFTRVSFWVLCFFLPTLQYPVVLVLWVFMPSVRPPEPGHPKKIHALAEAVVPPSLLSPPWRGIARRRVVPCSTNSNAYGLRVFP